jgi:thymidylate synthase (FAD)
MNVELVDSAGGDLSVVNSARVSFSVEKDILESKDERLISYLAKHRHDTPFRHNFIQLKCKVPLFLARQLMKHQAGLTWNEESRRYIDHTPEFYTPKEWRARPEKSIKQGSAGVVKDFPRYKDIVGRFEDTAGGHYEAFVEKSLEIYDEMLANNVAPEMARMVLPQSMYVNFIWSGNLLAFFHVYSLRSGEGAQEEAKEFAEMLKVAIEPEFPVSWKALQDRL